MKRLAWILLIAVAAPAYSGVYKWVDDKGNVHYSDRPVGEAQKLRIQNNPQPAAEGQDGYRRTMDDAKERFRMEDAARDGKVLVGMTPEQVKTAWGAPRGTRTITDAEGVSEQWTYVRGGAMTELMFRGGRVQSIDRSEGGGMSPAASGSAPGAGTGSEQRLKSECASLKSQLTGIAQEMRAGYSGSRGATLNERKRNLERSYGDKGCDAFN